MEGGTGRTCRRPPSRPTRSPRSRIWKGVPALARLPRPPCRMLRRSLFRRLFCGREDVFARRWENPQTGRSGYSPACANEWMHGLCEKKKGAGRRASCGECPTQAFSPVTDEEITKHLNGTHVMGVYPLLPNETCWFLARLLSWESCIFPRLSATLKNRDV